MGWELGDERSVDRWLQIITKNQNPYFPCHTKDKYQIYTNIFQYQLKTSQSPNPQPNQHLQLQDLNTIIKHYTNLIYQRFMQLQGHIPQPQPLTHPTTTQQQHHINTIITKYTNYQLINQLEMEYVKKMVQRVLQIFGFYKWKCRNQSILNHVQRQLNNKLNILLMESNVKVGKIMGYVIGVAKRGFVYRLNHMVHNTHTTTNNTQTNLNTTLTNPTNNLNIIGKTPLLSTKSKRRIYTKCQDQKQTTTIQTLKQQIYQSQSQSQSQNQSQKRRTASVMCYSSFNNNPIVDVIHKLYSCMNIDKVYLGRIVQSQNYLMRDQLKRNRGMMRKVQGVESVNKDREKSKEKEKQKEKQKQKDRDRQKIGNSTRKIRTQISQLSQVKNILKQVRPNIKIYQYNQSFNQFYEQKKAPIINLSALQKKRCKVKTSCWKRNNQKKVINNQNNFI